MKQRSYFYTALFAVLFASNWALVIWLTGGSGTALARFLGAPQSAVTIPSSFSYQGVLRDSSGNLVTGTVNLTLRLYDNVIGGTTIYTETFSSLAVRNGAFGVVVGNNTPLDPSIFSNGNIFLGLQINSDAELLPRQRLHAVPWALFAAEANEALLADNLVNGGGVPSQLSFSNNGGSIIDSSSGMTLTGGVSGDVHTSSSLAVGNDLSVAGDFSVAGEFDVAAIRDIGNSESYTATYSNNPSALSRSTYPLSLKRYVVEAPDDGTAPDSVVVDDAILTQLCQDIDGCMITLGMQDYGVTNGTPTPDGLMATVGPHRFMIGTTVADSGAVGGYRRPWQLRLDDGTPATLGTDGKYPSNVVQNSNDACYFEDVSYHNGAKVTTDGLGFHLVNWFGTYQSPAMVCVLIVED